MAGSRSKINTIVVSILWVGGVCGAMVLAIKRRDEQGMFSYLSMGLGVVMLVLFVAGYLPRRLKKKNLVALIDKLFVGLLLLLVIAFLAYMVITGYSNFGLLGTGFLLLFLVTFIRIFISFVKDSRKELQAKRGKTDRKDGGGGGEAD